MILHLRAPNDVNEHPRRLWLRTVAGGGIEVHDEGHAGPPRWAHGRPRMTVPITSTTYKRIMRDTGGGRHSLPLDWSAF